MCSLFLLCQKNSGLYPSDHPRVQSSLAELRQAVAQLHAETGRSFLLETIPVQEPAVEKSSKDFRDPTAMRRLLMAQFIETITIDSWVTESELGELCTILREDLMKSRIWLRPVYSKEIRQRVQSLVK